MKKLYNKEFSDYIKNLKLFTINNLDNSSDNIEIDDMSIIDDFDWIEDNEDYKKYNLKHPSTSPIIGICKKKEQYQKFF